MFNNNFYRQKIDKNRKKKLQLCVFLRHMLKYAKICRIHDCSRNTHLYEANIFFCVVSAEGIVHVFHCRGATYFLKKKIYIYAKKSGLNSQRK